LREAALIIYAGIRGFVADALEYRDLNPDERHMFWKRLQAAAFLALLPVFLVLGAASRFIKPPPTGA